MKRDFLFPHFEYFPSCFEVERMFLFYSKLLNGKTCWSIAGEVITIKSIDNCMWAIYSFVCDSNRLSRAHVPKCKFLSFASTIVTSCYHSFPVINPRRERENASKRKYIKILNWPFKMLLLSLLLLVSTSFSLSLFCFWTFYWPPNFLL